MKHLTVPDYDDTSPSEPSAPEYKDLVEVWYDGKIDPGEKWDEVIQDNIRTANIIIFCVSKNLFSSDYVRTVEIPNALRRHNNREDVTVIPVIVGDCLWKESKLRVFQGIPSRGRAIRNRGNIDQALKEVTCGIFNAVRTRMKLGNPRLIASPTAQSIKHVPSQMFNLFSIYECVRSNTSLGYPYIAVDSGRRYFMEISHDHVVLEEFDEEKLDFMTDYDEVQTIQPLEFDADSLYVSAMREYRAPSVSITAYVDDRVLVVAASNDRYSEWEYSFVGSVVSREDRKFAYMSEVAEDARMIQLDNDRSVQLPASTSEYKCVIRMKGLRTVLDMVGSLSAE